MPDTFNLNCCILGDNNPRRVFTVEIDNNKTVSILQETMKHAFESVDPDALVLWKVSIPVDKSFKESFSRHDFVEKQALKPVQELVETFTEPLAKKHVHIGVKAPPIVVTHPSPNSERLLELNCLVLGDDPGRVFPVKIAASESVGILRETIKDKKKPELDHIAADALALWNVSIPLNESFKNNLSKLDLVEKRSLLPEQELVEIFTGPPPAKKHVHIVVKAPSIVIPNLSTQLPPWKGSKLDTIDELSERLSFVQLENSQARVIEDALKADSPSSAAVLNAYRKGQEKCPILNGRPYTNRGIPIQLYHSSFAKFLRAVRDGDVQMDLKPEDYATTQSLFHSSATLYPDEAHRTQAIRVFLNKAIHHHIEKHSNFVTVG